MIETTRSLGSASTVVLVHPHGRLASTLSSTSMEVATILDAVGLIARAAEQHPVAAVVVDRQQLERFPDAAATIKQLDDRVRIIEIADEVSAAVAVPDIDASLQSGAAATSVRAAVTGRMDMLPPHDHAAPAGITPDEVPAGEPAAGATTISTWPFEPARSPSASRPESPGSTGSAGSTDSPDLRASAGASVSEPSSGVEEATESPDSPASPESGPSAAPPTTGEPIDRSPAELVGEEERRALAGPVDEPVQHTEHMDDAGHAGHAEHADDAGHAEHAEDAEHAEHTEHAEDASRRGEAATPAPPWPAWPGDEVSPGRPDDDIDRWSAPAVPPPTSEDRPDPTPTRRTHRASDRNPDAAPADGPPPLSFAEAVRARESQYDTQVERREPLGDVDLVEAVLAGEGRIGPVAVQLIREQTGWNDLAFHAHDPAPSERSPETAHAEVHDDGRRFGVLTSDIAGADELELWAGWLSRWLELGRRHELYRSQSRTDELTGAANRRELFAFLDEILTEARIRRRPVTVMVFDIDDFKRFNDEHGHEAGDTILRETVALLRSVTRQSDRVCRIGGDEFAVVFADIEGPRTAGSSMLDDVEVIARRFQSRVQAMHFPRLGLDAPGMLSISAGLATFPWDGTDAACLLRVADQRALESKRRGKNHITFGPGVVFAGDADRADSQRPVEDDPGRDD